MFIQRRHARHKTHFDCLSALVGRTRHRLGHGPAAGDAKSVLKAMSDYMSSQKTIEITFDSDIEVITPQLEKIQFTNSGEMLLSRPDKLRAHRVGGYADVALYFDGKTVSVFGKHINGYAQFDAPGTVDHLIETLRLGHGVALPGADLLLSNAYDVLVAGVRNPSISAVASSMAWSASTSPSAISIRTGSSGWRWGEAHPRKLVITSKTLNNAPQYTSRQGL